MTSRVLVVDDLPVNARLLEAKLMSEYFQVEIAGNGPEALAVCARGECDVVLLDVMMPGMDGFEVCRRLKGDPQTAHIPVVMVSALDQRSDRLEGLSAGADDFITKPYDDMALMTRVRSLSRLKQLTDELRLRARSGGEEGEEALPDSADARVLVVDDAPRSYERLVRALAEEADVAVETEPHAALFRIAEEPFDMVVISLAVEGFDALRLCSQLRSLDATRNVPIVLVADDGQEAAVRRGLDMGVNDYIRRPVDALELRARTRTQIRRKRMNEALRASVQQTMEMALKDGLTGLNNRRYFDRHAAALFDKARTGRSDGRDDGLALVVLDIDHFKQVNDEHGHAVGDEVLREFARRIARNVRSRDMICRFGGEEFVALMPGTDQALAVVVADRMRKEVAAHPFIVEGGRKQLAVTVSAGVAVMDAGDQDVRDTFRRADQALYAAKRDGRDRVMAQAA